MLNPSLLLTAAEPTGRLQRVYVGTMTNRGGEGIYRFEFDPSTGKASAPVVVAQAVNPNFLALDSQHKYLYAVDEMVLNPGTPDEKKVGSLTSFTVDPKTGNLSELNSQPTRGGVPCYVCVGHKDHYVFAANYSGGNAVCFPIQSDGSLAESTSLVQHTGHGTNPRRQKAAYAHSINMSPDNRFAFVADLGIDQIRIYRFSETDGTLTPNDPPFVRTKPGAGPRHFAFHPNGKYAYNNNELDLTVVAYRYDAEKGTLTPLQTLSTAPDATGPGNTTADLEVHPSGKFVYVSNRGPHTIAIFQVQKDGTLKAAGHAATGGKTPRNFNIDPTGKFLLAANQDSDNIVVFEIDQETGALNPTGEVIEIPAPVCVKMITLK